ncbi:DUF998 domain-containing protein [Microbacterium sp. NPDC055910]|uniref:DUF998 domain-containing protein n=1 Tax=Microbacterium sp. NPDC055910 TaxID=3345659 RepID=UPI0035DEC390
MISEGLATDPKPRRALIDDESAAIIIAASVFVVSAIVAAVVFWGRELPIAGRGSLGEFVAIAGAVAAALAFAGGRWVASVLKIGGIPGQTRARYLWFDLVALSVAHAAIALLGWTGIATVLEHSFIGATVFTTPAVVMAAAATALSGYAAYLSGLSLTPRQLSLVLALFLAVGMITAMLSSNDPQWWQMNLSALGITHDISSLTFNLTLIISGVIVTTIARFGTASLPAETVAERRRRAVVRALFVLIGVMLACVGVFPVDRFFLLHNTVATGMAVAFGVLVIGAPWLLPTVPKTFIVLGYVFVAAVAGLALLFAVGIYNLTAVELIAAVLIFAWIILFLRNVQTRT